MMRFACALLAALLALTASAADDVDRALEQRVKAAYLHRFTEFVSWPDAAFAAPDAPFIIMVAGSDGIAAEVTAVTAGRTVGNRRIEVRRSSEPGTASAQLHMLFVAKSERARIAQFARAGGKHTLIVTESEGALAQGSVINFVLAEGRVRFEVSLDSAERRGLKLSARLLGVAYAVRGTP